MSTDATLTDLIDRAAAATGSEYKLAKLLGVNQSRVWEWKTGKVGCVPEDRARLAAIAGEDAVQELVRATLAKHAGTRRGEQLARILGKPLRVIGGGLGIVALTLGSLICCPRETKAAALHNV